ncbi:MAG TPA: hypothetical protein VJY63_06340 [Marinospirillum sp.]|uniref:hypothetical protein n=1 Tax=Marinospirillum sp. TaxID=2183934 RepID=UPI002B48FE76|nr:hypothetical protein [Marinospirillum sp.]HKM15525.1 hypothetical protein [Marinospirillum sp.]
MHFLPKHRNGLLQHSSLKNSLLTLALLLMLQCIVPQAVADDAHKIQLIELQHRSAIEVLKAVKPHLMEGTVASQNDQKLIISGKTTDLEQLALLIHALDQPVQGWRVFFAQGHVNLQDLQLKNTRHYSTARAEVFEVLVREGASARLERGFWIPVQTGRGNNRETGYEWLASGFWVTVQPVGNQLILNLSTQQAQPNQKNLGQSPSPNFLGRQFEGEVALQLGQWTTLGSEAQLAAQIPNTARRYMGGSSNEYYSICIESSRLASCPR